MDTTERDIGVVLAWHDAINLRDEAAVRRLTTEDVGMAGPRSSDGGRNGQDMLVDWMHRSGIRLVVRSHHVGNGSIVVEEDASWDNDPQIHRVATVFRVSDGLISKISRHATLGEALRHA